MHLLPLLVLRCVLGLCLVAYTAYAGLAVWSVRKWSRETAAAASSFSPGITLLKPVCGVDAEAWENFSSICRVDYPLDRFQILFGALDEADPALELARRLQSDYPDHDIRIVVAPPDSVQGNNRKVCNLLSMLPHASHDLLVLCDSDMRVQPDYLRRIAAPFRVDAATVGLVQRLPADADLISQVQTADVTQEQVGHGSGPGVSGSADRADALRREDRRDWGAPGPRQAAQNSLTEVAEPPAAFARDSPSPSQVGGNGRSSPAVRGAAVQRVVGLVTCPYRGASVHSFSAAIEALSIGADFIPSTMVSRAIEGVSFALGSTIAIPRRVLEQIGGLEPLVDELADDYRLGNGVYKAGYEVVLSNYVIDDVLGREQFANMWSRRLRWSRTLRVCRPLGYVGVFLTYGFALALLFLVAMGFSTVGWIAFGAITALRFATALTNTLLYTRDRSVLKFWYLLPVGDLIGIALYAASFFGRTILWRGERFHLLPGGRLARDDRRTE